MPRMGTIGRAARRRPMLLRDAFARGSREIAGPAQAFSISLSFTTRSCDSPAFLMR
jgi:hypothetical protein